MEMVKNAERASIKLFAAGASSSFMTIVLATTAPAAELLWTGDFETGDFSQYISKLSGEGTRSSKRIVTSPVRSGRYATELTILGLGSESGNERAELIRVQCALTENRLSEQEHEKLKRRELELIRRHGSWTF